MKIYDICKIRMGYAFRSGIQKSDSGNMSVIQPKDISDSGLLQEEDVYQVDIDSINSGHTLAPKDVLLSNRGRFASTVYSGQFGAACIASGSIMILTVKEKSAVLPEYLALYFNSKSGKRQFDRFNETTTIPFVSRVNLEKIDIPVPTLKKQQAMIELEHSKQCYEQLTTRKVNLLNGIINHELRTIEAI